MFYSGALSTDDTGFVTDTDIQTRMSFVVVETSSGDPRKGVRGSQDCNHRSPRSYWDGHRAKGGTSEIVEDGRQRVEDDR